MIFAVFILQFFSLVKKYCSFFHVNEQIGEISKKVKKILLKSSIYYSIFLAEKTSLKIVIITGQMLREQNGTRLLTTANYETFNNCKFISYLGMG